MTDEEREQITELARLMLKMIATIEIQQKALEASYSLVSDLLEYADCAPDFTNARMSMYYKTKLQEAEHVISADTETIKRVRDLVNLRLMLLGLTPEALQ